MHGVAVDLSAAAELYRRATATVYVCRGGARDALADSGAAVGETA